MIETYKEVGRFRADILHKRTGQMIDYKAVILEGPSPGQFHIDHSHTAKPTETALGPWYSNSYTSAPSLEDAEALVKGWMSFLADLYEIVPWTADL